MDVRPQAAAAERSAPLLVHWARGSVVERRKHGIKTMQLYGRQDAGFPVLGCCVGFLGFRGLAGYLAFGILRDDLINSMGFIARST